MLGGLFKPKVSSVSTDLLGGHVGKLPKMIMFGGLGTLPKMNIGCILRILISVRAFTISNSGKDARHATAMLQPTETVGGRTYFGVTNRNLPILDTFVMHSRFFTAMSLLQDSGSGNKNMQFITTISSMFYASGER